MAGIYQADVFCDDCINEIKDRLAAEWFESISRDGLPDGADIEDGFESVADLNDYLRGMDERNYDSDQYPKWCSDDEESDCPEHCGSHEDCLNAEELSDGTKCGHCFGNSLTSDGADYVVSAVNEDRLAGDTGSVACELWADVYFYLDYSEVVQCASCGDWVDECGLDEFDDCENCDDREDNVEEEGEEDCAE